MTDTITPKKRGRPAAFDYDQALQQAMLAFWQYGYEGTSMSTLVEVMRMNKPSIYAAYGDKEALFQKAVERYVAGPASFVAAALQQETVLSVIQTLLTQAAQQLAGKTYPVGCLVTKGALAGSADTQGMQALLNGYRSAIELRFRQRFEQAQAMQEIPVQLDVAALAKLLMTIHQGMTVQAVAGATTAELRGVAEVATSLFRQQLEPVSAAEDSSA